MIEMRISHPPDGYALLGRICSCAIDLLRFFFFVLFGFGLSLGYGLLFARLARRLNFCPPHTSTKHNVRPELMTLKMLKYSNRQTGFPFPIQANRLAIIVFTVSNSLSLNLESLVPTWVTRAQRCLSSKNHRVCISISDGFPISMALAKPDAPAKPALRLMAMLTNSRDH